MFTLGTHNFPVELLRSDHRSYGMVALAVDRVDYLHPELVQPGTFLGFRDALCSYQDQPLFGIKKPDTISFRLWRLDLSH
jgi:hypothetical protein